MHMRVIMLAFSWAASSLTLAAPSSTPALPQAQEQRAVDVQETSSGEEVNKVSPSPTKKIASGLEAEPFESSYRGFRGLEKRFLEDQEQIWTSPAKIRFSDTQWLVPLSGITAGLFVTVETLKYSLGRQRPFQGDGTGLFFRGGTSFPSEHSAAAWSVAGVVAH